MKITNVRIVEVEGADRAGLAIYESPRGGLPANAVTPHREIYTLIDTDEGITGMVHGGSPDVKAVGALLIGEDPLRVEYLWEKLYYSAYHRQKAPTVGLLDLALWDIAGKARNEPVYRLLGGPTRERIRAYVGMLGFSTEPARAAECSIAWVEQGFTALKWYLPGNATDGADGLRRNVALIAAVRKAVGEDVEIMVDCLLSNPRPNSLLYAIELARRLEEFRPTWLEEPLSFDDLDAHVRLSRATRIPLAFGEHFFTRWQIRDILESGAATVLQPDPDAAGGITEMRKIIALASAYGVPVVPHANQSCRNALHLLFASPERICPLAEWGVKINHNVQHFYQDFYEPKAGYFPLPPGPGFGYELDPAKIRRQTEV
ncbi:MAG: enolase C-terminal domain-like protein [Chloroflexota bacterium]